MFLTLWKITLTLKTAVFDLTSSTIVSYMIFPFLTYFQCLTTCCALSFSGRLQSRKVLSRAILSKAGDWSGAVLGLAVQIIRQ